MKALNQILAAGLIVVCMQAIGAPHPELKPYPAAQDGMERHVIVLPHKARGEDHNFRVELIAGKTITTDGVNIYFMSNVIEEKTLEGWGYPYFEVGGNGGVGSTLIGVPEGTPEVEKFVSGKPIHFPYNSRLPVVVYAPRGYEIRYRIWRTDPEYAKAEQG